MAKAKGPGERVCAAGLCQGRILMIDQGGGDELRQGFSGCVRGELG